jgi:hypothetical protein
MYVPKIGKSFYEARYTLGGIPRLTALGQTGLWPQSGDDCKSEVNGLCFFDYELGEAA